MNLNSDTWKTWLGYMKDIGGMFYIKFVILKKKLVKC